MSTQSNARSIQNFIFYTINMNVYVCSENGSILENHQQKPTIKEENFYMKNILLCKNEMLQEGSTNRGTLLNDRILMR